jgi:hypothetical protein
MKLQTLSAAIFAVALGGCAVPQVNYQSVTTNISEPPLNSINEKQLGDELLRQGVDADRKLTHL